MRRGVGLLALVASACAGDEPKVTTLHDSAAAATDFYALPFPSDLRRDADGTVSLAGHVSLPGLVEKYLAIFDEELTGFGTNSGIFVRFSAAIEADSLPQTPEAAKLPTSSVYLVELDAAHRGERWPLRCKFTAEANRYIGTNWLACLPYPGFPLRGATRYGFVVTRRVQGEGEGVGPGPELQAVLAGGGDARTREVLAPLLAWLDEPGGDERDDVAMATVFTTSDPTSLMGKLRQAVREGFVAPTAQITATQALTGFTLVRGTYESPNFQAGDPPYRAEGGNFVLDDDGRPLVQRTETLRFAMSVPSGAAPEGTGWPVVLYAHGTGGDYQSFVRDGTARRMAEQGLATISIDQVLHGPRDPSGSEPELTFVNLDNPVASRDNVRQSAADDFQLVRLVQGPDIAGFPLDGDRVYFMGHSQGGLTGPPFLAFEPEVQGAVLSGAGGLIYFTLLYKTEPVDIPALVPVLLGETTVDEFHPVLSLIQAFLEPGDPVNYGPLLVREPIAGVTAKHIFQSEGLVDSYTPPPNIEAFGVSMGLSPVAPVMKDVPGFVLRDRPVLTPPVSANLGAATAVFLQYTAVEDDGHFVVFDIPAAQVQHARFLGTLAADGVATLVAP